MGEIHLPIVPQQKARFYKKLKDALDDVGIPDGTWETHAELTQLLALHEERRQVERLEAKGTLDKLGPYVTDFGKDCGKAIWYANQNTTKTNPPDEYSRLLFALGHAAEEAYASMYEAAGWDVKREVSVSFVRDDVEIRGRIDFLVTNNDVMFELKSTQAEKFKWVVAKREPGRAEHRAQLNAYLHYRNLNREKIDRAQLRYIITDAPKGTPSVLTYWVDYDADKAEWDIARQVRIWKLEQEPGRPAAFDAEYVSAGRPPQWPCLYCDYRDGCWYGKWAEEGAA